MPNTVSLGRWCGDQRKRYGQGKVPPERIAKLEAIVFCWDIHGALWDKRYAELEAFKETHGHCCVPSSTDLGDWCVGVRRRRKEGRVSAERIAQLDALGFRWVPKHSRFAEPGSEGVECSDRVRC